MGRGEVDEEIIKENGGIREEVEQPGYLGDILVSVGSVETEEE